MENPPQDPLSPVPTEAPDEQASPGEQPAAPDAPVNPADDPPPPGNGDLDEAAVEKGESQLEEAGGGH